LDRRGDVTNIVVLDLTEGGKGVVRIFDAQSKTVRATLLGNVFGISCAAFTRDGTRVVTGSADNTAKVWDVSTGHLVTSMEGHRLPVNCVAFSSDGNLVVTASGDAVTRIWDAWSGKLLSTFEGHVGPVGFASFSPDGTRLLTVGWEGMARVWDVHLEDRAPAEILGMASQRAPWHLADGNLVRDVAPATRK
jgi:WD40 repeat protein